ncbi:MAG TPA: hypothetical protein PLQ00_11715 [Thermoguttaceae bacterium]|nr:hypothetical protein [Thermoguttaceae bacterium]
MSIWNKVLLGFIFLLSLGFFYMAARTLKTHQVWRESAQKYEQAIRQTLKGPLSSEEISGEMLGLVAKGTLSPYNETIQEILQETEAVREGEQKSLRSLRAALDRELFMRGRVWRDVRPAKRPTEPNEKGEFELMVDMASEQHQLTDKMVLYLFEEKLAQDGGRYLGEFRVSGVGGKQVTLNPAKKMDQEEYNRLVKSSGPWVIYERLPMDRHDLFEGLSEQDLKAMMPSAYQEILRHGQPAKADDPPECVVDGKYQRPLIDFALALNHAHIRRSQLIDLKKAAERDKEMIDKALAVAQAQQKVYEQQKEEAEKALKQMESERNAAAAHLKEVEERLAANQAEIQKTIDQIQNLTRQIARIQLEVSRKIEERTRAALQADAVR